MYVECEDHDDGDDADVIDGYAEADSSWLLCHVDAMMLAAVIMAVLLVVHAGSTILMKTCCS